MSFDFRRDFLPETENPIDYIKFEDIVTAVYNAFPDMEIDDWFYNSNTKHSIIRLFVPIYKDGNKSIKLHVVIRNEHCSIVYGIDKHIFQVGSCVLSIPGIRNHFSHNIQDKFNCLKHPILVEKIWGNPVMNWLDNNTYPLVDILKLCSNILNAKNTVEAHHILSIWEVEDALNNL